MPTVFSAETHNRSFEAARPLPAFCRSFISRQESIRGFARRLTAYAEFYYDDRRPGTAFTPFQRDVFVGARYAAKDTHDSVAELRATHDLQWPSMLFEVRASRRVAGDAVVLLDLILPAGTRRDPALATLRRDANLRVGLTRYF